MSNSLSLAMVTAALSRILAEALSAAQNGGVPNARVTTLRPDMLADGEARGINLFLYQVASNPAWMGVDLPSRRPDGSLVARPEQALDLHYLLTFSGDEAALEPQRMLGVAVATLVSRPVLSRDLVRNRIARAVGADPNTWEQFSNLADQVDVVRFTLLPLNLEDLSKLWSNFFQTPYRLSVAYQAAVVLIEDDLTPQAPLPVLTRGIDVAATTAPEITGVSADTGPTDPVGAGTRLRIEGRRLRGAFRTLVRVGDVETAVRDDQATGTRLVVDVPGDVRAGVCGVQVLHPRLVGTPPVERGGAESPVAALVIRPALTAAVTAAPAAPPGTVGVTLPLAPPVGRRQRVVLTLNEHHPPADRLGRSYTVTAAFDPARPDPADTVTVPVSGVPAGAYLVRVQVDGAESMLAPGVDGRFDQPRVLIP